MFHTVTEHLISNTVAKWPRSVHDARILQESPMAQRLNQGKAIESYKCTVAIVHIFI